MRGVTTEEKILKHFKIDLTALGLSDVLVSNKL